MKLVITLLLWMVFVSCDSDNSKSVKTGLEGKPLPSFSLLLPDSATYTNATNIPAGEPVVLLDFGPQCPYCNAQMKEIISNMDKLKHIRFFLSTSWPFTEMKHFYEHYELKKYPNIITGTDYAGFFTKYFHSEQVPYIAIYNSNKRLNKVYVGNIKGTTIIKSTKE